MINLILNDRIEKKKATIKTKLLIKKSLVLKICLIFFVGLS